MGWMYQFAMPVYRGTIRTMKAQIVKHYYLMRMDWQKKAGSFSAAASKPL